MNINRVFSRASLARVFERQCARSGIPITYGISVESYHETQEQAFVITSNGKVEADVLIAADGIGTKSQVHIGNNPGIVPSGYALYRAITPRKHLENMGDFVGQDEVRFYTGLVARYKKPQMFAMTFFTSEGWLHHTYYLDDGSGEDNWDTRKSTSDAVDHLKHEGWDPTYIKAFSLSGTEAHNHRLLWRDPQPNWTAGGRIIQLEDAAHAFLPVSGNGANQALEDGLSLATCLRLAGKEEVQLATKVHVKLRYQTVSTFQRLGFVNGQQFSNLYHIKEKLRSGGLPMKFGKWRIAHDPGQYALDNFYRAARWVQKDIAGIVQPDFVNYNLPPGFVHRDWTIQEEMERGKLGKSADIWNTGDWS